MDKKRLRSTSSVQNIQLSHISPKLKKKKKLKFNFNKLCTHAPI